MLAEKGDEGSVYAGGTELLLAMRHGALRYQHLIDVKVLPGFDSILLHEGWIEIGAGATHRAIEYSPIVQTHLKVLSDLESRVANVRVRASGTIGGNLCFAEPHSDPATLLLALDAVVTVAGTEGTRQLRVDELINGAYSNSLQPGELLMSIRVPALLPGQRAAYVKYQVHERPTLGLAIVMDTAEDGATITRTRVAIGCLCPYPRRSAAAEALLTGTRNHVATVLTKAAGLLADDAELIDDHEGAVDYKRHLLGVFLLRAMEQALTAA